MRDYEVFYRLALRTADDGKTTRGQGKGGCSGKGTLRKMQLRRGKALYRGLYAGRCRGQEKGTPGKGGVEGGQHETDHM